jgi:hypothetical protein
LKKSENFTAQAASPPPTQQTNPASRQPASQPSQPASDEISCFFELLGACFTI